MSNPTAASRSSAERPAPRASHRRLAVEAWRGARPESWHSVACAIVPPVGLEPDGDAAAHLPVTYMRSAVKPLQLLPLVTAGGMERFGLDPIDLAVMAASHHGTDDHADRVADILRRVGLGPEALRCGSHRPYFLGSLPADSPERLRTFGPLHNNCSGNHAAMLALGLVHGVEPSRYLDPEAPTQQLIHAVVRALSAAEPDLAIDNCAAPCYAMPLACMAEAYRFLARPAAVHELPAARRALLAPVADLERIEAALDAIAAAMAHHPEWVSGSTTGATRMARELPGEIVIKRGAEGILCAAHRRLGTALALKVEDGTGRALMPALIAVATDLGWFTDDTRLSLASIAEPVLHGRLGQPIGRLQVRSPRAGFAAPAC